MFAGAAIRQFFVMRHGFKLGRNANPLPYALVGVVVVVGVIAWLKPAPPSPAQAKAATGSATANPAATPGASATSISAVNLAVAAGPADYVAVVKVLEQRCTMCHGAQVQMKNLRFDTPDQLKLHAQNIYQQAVVTKVMPMNNSTGVTDDERLVIKQWFEAGAKTQ